MTCWTYTKWCHVLRLVRLRRTDRLGEINPHFIVKPKEPGGAQDEEPHGEGETRIRHRQTDTGRYIYWGMANDGMKSIWETQQAKQTRNNWQRQTGKEQSGRKNGGRIKWSFWLQRFMVCLAGEAGEAWHPGLWLNIQRNQQTSVPWCLLNSKLPLCIASKLPTLIYGDFQLSCRCIVLCWPLSVCFK